MRFLLRSSEFSLPHASALPNQPQFADPSIGIARPQSSAGPLFPGIARPQSSAGPLLQFQKPELRVPKVRQPSPVPSGPNAALGVFPTQPSTIALYKSGSGASLLSVNPTNFAASEAARLNFFRGRGGRGAESLFQGRGWGKIPPETQAMHNLLEEHLLRENAALM